MAGQNGYIYLGSSIAQVEACRAHMNETVRSLDRNELPLKFFDLLILSKTLSHPSNRSSCRCSHLCFLLLETSGVNADFTTLGVYIISMYPKVELFACAMTC